MLLGDGLLTVCVQIAVVGAKLTAIAARLGCAATRTRASCQSFFGLFKTRCVCTSFRMTNVITNVSRKIDVNGLSAIAAISSSNMPGPSVGGKLPNGRRVSRYSAPLTLVDDDGTYDTWKNFSTRG